jgi:glycosyltransferase involved in cell wall biosynthesis
MNNPTIIIPTKNEEKYIGNILLDLNKQILPDITNKLKVIIADAYSTDNTLNTIQSVKVLCTNLDISVIGGGAVSVGRNNGFREIVSEENYSEIIIFIDADVRLFNPNVIIDTVYELGKYRLVTCKLKDYSDSLRSKFAFWLYNKIHFILSKKYPFAIGAYFATHSSDFKKFGMFNELSDNSEDFLFSQNYTPSQFHTLPHFIGQDDRRFKKMGYIGMGWHLLRNLTYYMLNGRTQFTKKSKYWN